MTFKPIKSALDSLNVYPPDWDQHPVSVTANEERVPEIHYDRKWVALLTEPNREQKAYDHLKKVSTLTPTEPYWPRYTRQVHVRARRQLCDRICSLFPGMMFASIAIGNIAGYRPFHDFEKAPGVRGYLRNGQGYPAYISGSDMCAISAIEEDQNSPPAPVKVREFTKGDRVKIINDLMHAWPPGTIARLNGDGSYNVEIPGLFGRVTTMRLFANQVEAV